MIGRVRARLREVRKVPEWVVLRWETVTGEGRGTWAVLVSSLSVGVVAAIMAAFVTYRVVHDRPAISVPGKVEGANGSNGGQENDTSG